MAGHSKTVCKHLKLKTTESIKNCIYIIQVDYTNPFVSLCRQFFVCFSYWSVYKSIIHMTVIGGKLCFVSFASHPDTVTFFLLSSREPTTQSRFTLRVNYMGQRLTVEAFTRKEKLIGASNYCTLSICLLRLKAVFDN